MLTENAHPFYNAPDNFNIARIDIVLGQHAESSSWQHRKPNPYPTTDLRSSSVHHIIPGCPRLCNCASKQGPVNPRMAAEKQEPRVNSRFCVRRPYCCDWRKRRGTDQPMLNAQLRPGQILVHVFCTDSTHLHRHRSFSFPSTPPNVLAGTRMFDASSFSMNFGRIPVARSCPITLPCSKPT